MEIRLPLLLDGATGTELQKCGLCGNTSTEEWVLSHPDSIGGIQRGYVGAGSRVVYAPTFGANRQKLEEHGIFNKVEEYNPRLVGLSRASAGDRAYVAGDMSPTGLFLRPVGQTPFEELVDIYTEQAAALESAGVDLFAVETMMTLSDARAAVLAIKSVSDKPVFVTFSCNEDGHTIAGEDIVCALTVLEGMGIDAFGLNCSAGPREMLPVLERLHEYARVPLIAKPNAGLPQIIDGKAVYDCPAEEFASYVPEMLRCGVAVFGGCCGTTSEHIAALGKALEGAKITPPAPMHADMLPAATEKAAVYLPPDAAHGDIIDITAALEDDIAAALDSAFPMVAIRFNAWEDIDAFSDCRHMLTKPLCAVCDDADILESVLRTYQGRALYEGALSPEALAPLCAGYGLII